MSTFGTFKIFYCQNYKFTIHDFHWVAKYLFRCYCCFIYAQLLTLISDVDTASFPAKGKVVDSLELPAPSSIFLCAGGELAEEEREEEGRGERAPSADSQAQKTHGSSARLPIDVSPVSHELGGTNRRGAAGECWLLYTKIGEKTE